MSSSTRGSLPARDATPAMKPGPDFPLVPRVLSETRDHATTAQNDHPVWRDVPGAGSGLAGPTSGDFGSAEPAGLRHGKEGGDTPDVDRPHRPHQGGGAEAVAGHGHV